MNLRKKIYLGTAVTVLLLLATIVIFFNGVIHYNGKLSKVTEEQYQNAYKVHQIHNSVSIISNSLRDLLEYPGSEDDIRAFNSLRASQEKEIAVVFEFMNSLELSDDTKQQFVSMRVEWRAYVDNIDVILSAVHNNGNFLKSALEQEKDSRYRLYADLESYLEKFDADIHARIASNKQKMNEMRFLLTLICIVMLLVVTLFIMSFTRKVFDNMERSVTVMNNMALGSVEPIERIEVKTSDEFSMIAEAYNRLAGTLERHIRYERAYQKEIEEQNWLKTTIAEITTMYQEIQDVGSLARKLLTKLIPLIGASYGAIYMMDESEGEAYLYKLATFAEKDPLNARDRFRMGEGLIGQCAIERQTIYLDHLTEYDVRIRSAMIDVVPSQVIIAPIEYEDKVLAVAEFATTNVFSALQRLLLHQVMGGMGITIRSVLDHMRVQLLLSDSQALTHELQTQSLEMQQQQLELMSTNEKLEEQYRSAELRSLELQSMKAELEDKAKLLEQSSRYKSEFLANMSHELRTPLNSLLILAKILQDNEGGRLSAKQSEYAGAIYSSGQQLLKLINDILELSKAESGKNQARKEPVRLIELLQFAERMFMPIAREKDVEFIIETDPRLPECIQSDPQRLQQIINNLLANAFKFTDRGQVSIQVTAIGETLVSDSFDWLAISVMDTGIGIAADKLSLVFEAFQQADGTTNRKYGGTGLGLSISKNSAELLGGSIKVISREGFGSTFTLYLPLEDTSVYRPPNLPMIQEAAVAITPQGDMVNSSISYESELPILRGKTILVVDNDIRSVFAITAILEAWQVNVLFAEDGREAVDKVENDTTIAMVLMDIMMPGMDGLEAIRLIRLNPMQQKLPIIALTAKAMKADREMCLEAGASGYISKPVQQEQLIALILEWLTVRSEQGSDRDDH